MAGTESDSATSAFCSLLTQAISDARLTENLREISVLKGPGAMRNAVLALLTNVLWVSVAFAAAGDDVAAPLRHFIDAFNKGDTASAYATYAKGEISIVDEFAPHRWSGTHAAQDWAAAYDKHAQATGVSDGQVKYGTPTRVEVEGELAYVILPTEYLYKEHGKQMDEKGQVTAVLHKEDGAWKIRAWTWSGEKPHLAK